MNLLTAKFLTDGLTLCDISEIATEKSFDDCPRMLAMSAEALGTVNAVRHLVAEFASIDMLAFAWGENSSATISYCASDGFDLRLYRDHMYTARHPMGSSGWSVRLHVPDTDACAADAMQGCGFCCDTVFGGYAQDAIYMPAPHISISVSGTLVSD